MINKNIVVIGSANTDLVIKTEKIPLPGETVLGDNFMKNMGGKGANQAVAAARLGGNITFIGKIGDDVFGRDIKEVLKGEKISVELFIDKEYHSGIATIAVDRNGENCIVVAPGSNNNLMPGDIDKVKNKILEADLILMQLEIPLNTVEYIVEMCNTLGKKVILNPAPYKSLNDNFLNKIDIIIPNETEIELLTGVKVNSIESAETAGQHLLDKGIQMVIITLGSKGAMVCTGSWKKYIPTSKVEAIDTTGAGDVFCGALAVALSEGSDVLDAVIFANKAASISVTRMGAYKSAPYRTEVEE